MVAIKNITLVSLLAAIAAAAPVAGASTELQVRDATAAELLAPFEEIQKREAEAALQVLDLTAVTTLLASLLSFLQSTLFNLGTLNVSGELASVVTLVTNLTTVLTQLVNSLTNVTVGTGLLGTLNKLIVNTGLTTLLSVLLSIVANLVKQLTGKTLDGNLVTVLKGLKDILNTLSATLGSAGLGNGAIATINSILGLLAQLGI